MIQCAMKRHSQYVPLTVYSNNYNFDTRDTNLNNYKEKFGSLVGKNGISE